MGKHRQGHPLFVFTGQFRRVWNEVHVRLYRWTWAVLWYLIMPFRRAGRRQASGVFTRETKHPVAFESPDHLAPKGTAVNDSTNKKFVLHMDARLRGEFGERADLRMMDLGCRTILPLPAGEARGEGERGHHFLHTGHHPTTAFLKML